MAFALIVLAIGSVVAGYAGLPAVLGGGDWFARFLEPSFGVLPVEEVAEHGLEGTLMILSSGLAFAGIGIAMYFFLTNRRAADAGRGPVLRRPAPAAEQVLRGRGLRRGGRAADPDRLGGSALEDVDVRVIDGAVNGVAETVGGLAETLRRLQTGSVRTYAASLLFGVVLILGYYLWR